MADLIPEVGLVNLLNLVVNTTFPLHARLFKNNITANAATVLTDLTEADFSGYAPVLLNPQTPPDVAPDGAARSQLIQVPIAHSGGPTANTVYGYYVTVTTDAGVQLLWVGQDDDFPTAMASTDDVVDLVIQVLETQEVS